MPRCARVDAQNKYSKLKDRQFISKKGFETPSQKIKGKEKTKGTSKPPIAFSSVSQGSDCVYGRLAITDAPRPAKGLVFGNHLTNK